MGMELLDAKKIYYELIEKKAIQIADNYKNGHAISEDILLFIHQIYRAAQSEKNYGDSNFSCAYHSPISGDLEFFIARILHHSFCLHEKNWDVLLRRQSAGKTPDIRIKKNNRTIAIIEVKAKGGWIQTFLSKERYEKDLSQGKNPQVTVDKMKGQLEKYQSHFELPADRVFFLLPTLKLVHRKKYKSGIKDYLSYFENTSGLPADNFILLSDNMNLDLACGVECLAPSCRFETMMDGLLQYSE